MRAGGDFASNRDAAPLGVKGGNSTLANTDTSGAVKLDAAPDKASRRDEGLDERVKYPEGAGGQGAFSGTHSREGYAGGPTGGEKKEGGVALSTGDKKEGGAEASTGDKKEGGAETSTGGEAGSGAKGQGRTGGDGGSASAEGDAGGEAKADIHQGDTAPSYVHSTHGAGGKPKGKNLTEGGFDEDDVSKNASFNSDIGDENDPGRGAEHKFAKDNAQSRAGSGPRQKEVTGDGQYDVLEDDQEL